MEPKLYPELVPDLNGSRTSINAYCELLTFGSREEIGYVTLYELHPGIWLWINDFSMHVIPLVMLPEYHYMKLNYCISGRCEVLLPGERYLYMEKQMVSLDINQAQAGFHIPAGIYQGIEAVFDMGILAENYPQLYIELGIDLKQLEAELCLDNGSFMGKAATEWKRLAARIYAGRCTPERLKTPEKMMIPTRETLRFYLLCLLKMLTARNMVVPCNSRNLSKGQRGIVTQTEQRLCLDLSRRYTIEELARTAGTSPSSLKKYFELMYGESISSYMRKKRMQQAMHLLRESQASIAQIAQQTGYENQSKFGTVFKLYTGYTPLEYRRLERRKEA